MLRFRDNNRIAQQGPRSNLVRRLKAFGTLIASILIDMGFLSLWAIVQWATHSYVIDKIALHEVQRWIILVFEFLFAVSTLAVVTIFIYEDIQVAYLQAKTRIQQVTRSKTRESNHEQEKQ